MTTRMRFHDGPHDVRPTRCCDAANDTPQGDELGELVATYPAGHVAKFGDDGSLNIYLKPDSAATTDHQAPQYLRLRALNSRNAKFYFGSRR